MQFVNSSKRLVFDLRETPFLKFDLREIPFLKFDLKEIPFLKFDSKEIPFLKGKYQFSKVPNDQNLFTESNLVNWFSSYVLFCLGGHFSKRAEAAL